MCKMWLSNPYLGRVVEKSTTQGIMTGNGTFAFPSLSTTCQKYLLSARRDEKSMACASFLTHHSFYHIYFANVKMHQKKERPPRFKGKRQSPSERPHSQRYFIYIYLLRAVCEAGKLAGWGFIRWKKGVSNAAFLLLHQMGSDGGEIHYILLNMFCLKAGASLRCLSERFLAGFYEKNASDRLITHINDPVWHYKLWICTKLYFYVLWLKRCMDWNYANIISCLDCVQWNLKFWQTQKIICKCDKNDIGDSTSIISGS